MTVPAVNYEALSALVKDFSSIVVENELLDLIVRLSGCHYKRDQQQTVFGLWAPYRKRKKIFVEIFVPKTASNSCWIYQRYVFELQRCAHSFDFGNDFYLVVINEIIPFTSLDSGALYRFCDLEEGSSVPDIYSFYQPLGVNGPSAVIDQTDYQWSSLQVSGAPISITKLHVGNASPTENFEGLTAEIQNNEFFKYCDAVELLPIGAFPGRGSYSILYGETELQVRKISEKKPINWGYDGGPNYLVSVSESYGTPNELKKLVDVMHEKNIKVGFDLQLNHYGPEGVYQEWYGPYVSAAQTEWGQKPDFSNTIIRQFLLKKAQELIVLYRPDYLRLDMSSRYGDDSFIADLRTTLAIPLILEDERDIPGLTDPQKTGALARWDFPAVHDLQLISKGNFLSVESVSSRILTKSNASVVFANSHDEQGNNQATPYVDQLTLGIAALTNGIAMFWYSFGYFHFFCNYENPLQMVRVTAEKCGVINKYPAEIWPLMTPLHQYFFDFKACQEFFTFIHFLWTAEVVPFLGIDKERYKNNVQGWIKNNPSLIMICEAYNKTIYELANIRNALVSAEMRFFIMELNKIRKENGWLYSNSVEGFVNFDKSSKLFFAVRSSKPNNTSITLTAKLGAEPSVDIKVVTL